MAGRFKDVPLAKPIGDTSDAPWKEDVISKFFVISQEDMHKDFKEQSELSNELRKKRKDILSNIEGKEEFLKYIKEQ